ncbi:SDR family NAD(P)-dependent oxidoreductase [Pontibacter diazotrophicus]|uniref:SDR family NAD(P)-dependent oxidoreductase n=1 Tax=Pontibacter diazotrophicus TaxID=1400979 RepID=A0A3D8LGI4_9BACT|nr:SDR family NAD(P)-dependent oxidoreductase [Pontibacter diazotrophicus]RDV16569.1 SDR family NAD(P)-dependent oxidoreductase [Pontibacter diazotrophicus]
MKTELSGKLIVITGGSSGIGAAAARMLNSMGAQVVITGRSEATRELAAELGCDYYLVDYASFSEVRHFAKTLLEKYPRIDVLVNNVGGIIADRRITADGHEMTLQVNHLSGFLLTQLLQERLEASKAVVINTSSVGNTMGKIDFNDLESEKGYNSLRAYGTAKLMNILHAMELSKRFKGVSAASFHPGGVETGFAREGSGFIKWIYETPLKRLFLISPEKGADTLIWLISSEPGKDWEEGEYYYKRKPGRKNAQVKPHVAQKLWEASEELITRQPKGSLRTP